MHQIQVNGKYEYKLERNSAGIRVNDNLVNADMRQLNASAWHVISGLRSYNVEMVDFNREDKTAVIKVNNNSYSITAKDEFDLLLNKMGLNNLAANRISELKAPMPGMVLKVLVAEGAEIKKGENLFILEAMKMENIIKAPGDVMIRAIKIKPGDKVEKGQVLLSF